MRIDTYRKAAPIGTKTFMAATEDMARRAIEERGWEEYGRRHYKRYVIRYLRRGPVGNRFYCRLAIAC